MKNKYIETYMGKSKNAFQRALVVTPIKTGNLRYKAMKYKRNKGGSATIRVDLAIAPYARYIDQPGYKTYGWWDKYLNQYLIELQKINGVKRRR